MKKSILSHLTIFLLKEYKKEDSNHFVPSLLNIIINDFSKEVYFQFHNESTPKHDKIHHADDN